MQSIENRKAVAAAAAAAAANNLIHCTDRFITICIWFVWDLASRNAA